MEASCLTDSKENQNGSQNDVCLRGNLQRAWHCQDPPQTRPDRLRSMEERSAAARIDDRLDQIEAIHEVTVLYACESGSRAWGFPSTDSDYDVRFIYVHPREWYLSIDLERRDDTIDPSIDAGIDLHGWDIRKALGLFRSANPTLMEWLRSPIVYREHEAVMAQWRDLLSEYYRSQAAAHAYRGMAQSVANQNLSDEPFSHKAYLYVLRALLAVRWIDQDRGPIPMAFDRLMSATVASDSLREAIDGLVTEKRAGYELEGGPRLPLIHTFITDELERQKNLQFPAADSRADLAPLNTLFRRVVNQNASLSPS